MNAARALGLWGYNFTFEHILDDDGRPYVFHIPALPASHWLIASFEPGHLGYVPGLLEILDRERLLDALADGELDTKEILDMSRQALVDVSGWSPWWSAGRLIGTLGASWHTVGGLLALSGIDPNRDGIGAILAALYARIWIDSSKEDRAKLAQQVAMPPTEMLQPDTFDEDAATAAVMAFINEGRTGIPG